MWFFFCSLFFVCLVFLICSLLYHSCFTRLKPFLLRNHPFEDAASRRALLVCDDTYWIQIRKIKDGSFGGVGGAHNKKRRAFKLPRRFFPFRSEAGSFSRGNKVGTKHLNKISQMSRYTVVECNLTGTDLYSLCGAAVSQATWALFTPRTGVLWAPTLVRTPELVPEGGLLRGVFLGGDILGAVMRGVLRGWVFFLSTFLLICYCEFFSHVAILLRRGKYTREKTRLLKSFFYEFA